MELKDRAAPSFRRDCKTAAGRLASVKMKLSIVAMSGAIMPEPLAIPLMVTRWPSIIAVVVASFGKVSVVMIASAAARQPPAAPASASAGRALTIFWYGRGSPMTPVEAMKTSWARQPTTPAADSATSRTASAPALPVKALALPLFTIRTRAVAPGSCLRHQSTGAEDVLDFVKTPATWLPGARTIMRTSVRSLYLMLAWPVARRTPASGGTGAINLGASGDLAGPAGSGAGVETLADADKSGLAAPLGGALAPVFFPPCLAMAVLLKCHFSGESFVTVPARRLGPTDAN